ncbi:uncharacterized protein [Littorina saxatilis]|uniref:uncharacterized protein n=1 Tax=Littorina saxatilis TaxID=31220 RepID=UPI0038B4FCAF
MAGSSSEEDKWNTDRFSASLRFLACPFEPLRRQNAGEATRNCLKQSQHKRQYEMVSVQKLQEGTKFKYLENLDEEMDSLTAHPPMFARTSTTFKLHTMRTHRNMDDSTLIKMGNTGTSLTHNRQLVR